MSNVTTETRGSFWSWRRLALAALAFAAVIAAASSCGSGGPPAQAPAGTAEVAQDVLTTEILDLDGATFRLSDYKGKTVVVDLWATWCGPCRDEIPHLVRVAEEYRAKGVEVVGLTVEDPAYDVRKVQDFARRYNINYRVGWASETWALKLTGGSQSIPQTFVIGPEGRAYLHLRGYSPQLPAQLRKAIDRAIKQ